MLLEHGGRGMVDGDWMWHTREKNIASKNKRKKTEESPYFPFFISQITMQGLYLSLFLFQKAKTQNFKKIILMQTKFNLIGYVWTP